MLSFKQEKARIWKIKELSTLQHKMKLVAALVACCGVLILLSGSLAGYIACAICATVSFVFWIIGLVVGAKMKKLFNDALSEIVDYKLRYSSYSLKRKGQGLRYVVIVYNTLGRYTKESLECSVRNLISRSSLNVKVNIKEE